MIIDQIKLENNYKALNLKCYSCGGDHLSQECPAIHFLPNKFLIVQKYVQDPGQIRSRKFKRRHKIYMNSKFIKKYMIDTFSQLKAFLQNCHLDDNIGSNDEEEEINKIKNYQNELKIDTIGSFSSFEKIALPIKENDAGDVGIELESKENQIQNFKETQKIHSSKYNVPIFFNPLYISFEKMFQFKNYYPDSNVRQILVQNQEFVEVFKKCKNPTSKKLAISLGNHLKKTIEKGKTQNIKIYPDESNINKEITLTNIFMQKIQTETFFKNPTFAMKLSFFDLVDQVLLNKELRKKLMNMKPKNLRKKKLNLKF